ncbi:hypothetical protein D5086_017774 [Populus alba]|uniref:Uncharacterized protein n=1 Tax=Populus alba TaxID=43335 RepID=A0ACC4BP84_POPAL
MWAFQSPKTTLLPSHATFLPRPSLKPPICSITLNPTASTADNNKLIQSLCKQGNLTQALKLLSHEPNPTQHTYELLLLSCSHQNSLLDAQRVHRHLLENGFDQDPFLATKLINMYSFLDSIDNARKVFDKTQNRTIYVYNALFRALSLAGHGEEVLNMYRGMNSIGIPSDRFTYTAMIACYAKNGKAFEALELFRELMLESQDLCPNSVTMVSVLQACAALAALEQGRLIHGYILRKGLDSILPVISALVTIHAGLVDEGKMLFKSMHVAHGICPSVEHYACMVDLLGRANRIHCNVELAERASIRLFDLEPTNAGNYVLLADIYAEAGSAMRSVTSWCTACIPGRKQKETKTEESEKSLRKKPSRDESSGPGDQAHEGSSHQGTTHAASSADTGGAAVVVMTATHMSDMEGSSHGGGGGGDGGGGDG